MSLAIEHRLRRRLDWPLLTIIAGIVLLSLPTIYSARLGAGGESAWLYVQKQALWLLVGAFAMALVNSIDHHQLKDLARPLYWLGALLLVVVLVVGTEVNGAKSWLAFGSVRLQPAELAKLTLILALADLFSDEGCDAGELGMLFRSGLVIGVPLLLILAQPDLGTALTCVAIWMAMLWWAGARWWQLLLIAAAGLAAFALLWHLDVLADYQKARIMVLFDPGADPRGQGYNIRNALIAVGSGGLDGQVWLQGTQTHLRFLPEAHTDFLFAVLAEEFGLLGAGTLLVLYAGLILRGWAVLARADSEFGRLVTVGCVAVLLTHIVLNIGMVMALLPITGLPLPFFSYGGSNLLMCLIVAGLLLNIGAREGALNY